MTNNLRISRGTFRVRLLGEELATAQHDAGVSLAPGRPDLVEIFEDLDRQIAPDTRAVLEGRRGKGALGRARGELLGDLGEARQSLRQKEAVVGDFGDASQSFGPAEKPQNRR